MEILFMSYHVWPPTKKKGSSFRFFYFLFLKYEERKAHNMLSWMLDLRFKTLHLVSSLISCEQGKVIVEEYDKKIFISYF
jgi:hypothetical protein